MMKNPLITPGLPVVILGFGITGQSAARYLLECGAALRVSDTRVWEDLKAEEQDFLKTHEIPFEGGGHSFSFVESVEKIIVSPGIPYDHDVLVQARDRNIPILGELALAGPVLNVPVVAITGTNGKTTVTSLIGHLLEKSGKKVFVGGNIGIPLFNFLLSREEVDVVVLEVSSFQLENCGTFRPNIGLLLNLTPDHLDRHGSLLRYGEAKQRLFYHQEKEDYAIVFGDDDLCYQLVKHNTKATTLMFGCNEKNDARVGQNMIEVNWQDKILTFDLSGSKMANHIGTLNSGAALLAALCLGCSQKNLAATFQDFSPPAHRMEFVTEHRGVSYINDSKATNTGAVLSALTQVQNTVLLIAGGRDKGDDYSLLADSVNTKVRILILIGEAANQIGQALGRFSTLVYAKSMEEAVKIASEMACPGETVLLSPACASFDMFTSYGHRGQVFSSAVQTLKNNDSLAKG